MGRTSTSRPTACLLSACHGNSAGRLAHYSRWRQGRARIQRGHVSSVRRGTAPSSGTDARAGRGPRCRSCSESVSGFRCAGATRPESARSLDWTLRGGVAEWVVANTGNVHLRAERVELIGLARDGTQFFEAEFQERYFLAGVVEDASVRYPS